MATHTPHFPDLLFPGAARLRRWESLLMGLLAGAGYQELRSSLVMREPHEQASLRFFDGDHLLALRWDYTTALARMLSKRFAEPPPRVSYAGAVFRRANQPWEAVERFEVGCERIHTDETNRDQADVEVARLLMAVPKTLGLRAAILQIGSAALLRCPMEAEQLPQPLADAVTSALMRRAPHRVKEALGGHPAAPRLLAHVEALLSEFDGINGLQALDRSPYADLLKAERDHLSKTLEALSPFVPEGLQLRLDLADVQGLDFYTGPTLRLYAPGAQQELAAGGRYDRLYPELGKPWLAAGFCVRLSPLLDLAETRPDMFDSLGAQVQ
jgi:ATP phosphoribosyltransferase regulatory subunit HisZ